MMVTRRVGVAGAKEQKLAAAGESESDQDGIGAGAIKKQPAVQYQRLLYTKRLWKTAKRNLFIQSRFDSTK